MRMGRKCWAIISIASVCICSNSCSWTRGGARMRREEPLHCQPKSQLESKQAAKETLKLMMRNVNKLLDPCCDCRIDIKAVANQKGFQFQGTEQKQLTKLRCNLDAQHEKLSTAAKKIKKLYKSLDGLLTTRQEHQADS